MQYHVTQVIAFEIFIEIQQILKPVWLNSFQVLRFGILRRDLVSLSNWTQSLAGNNVLHFSVRA